MIDRRFIYRRIHYFYRLLFLEDFYEGTVEDERKFEGYTVKKYYNLKKEAIIDKKNEVMSRYNIDDCYQHGKIYLGQQSYY